ncbi:hypothetical protein FOA43_004019 [Brettanomyces nanus]|uniref:Uncharacterized protein n=1 Tax=Eeniella nana TaxID=13502 RepID=A0A875RX13_EENNA|nr:uncharacterized protein FOA43_004019 [Brettanomyces nanus]QPG76627.1 hypothetical protein FOA43_004019 [Brettanomyces nanus]
MIFATKGGQLYTSQYLSVLLQLKPSQQQKQLLNRTLAVVNNSIRARYLDLNKGFFNGLSVPFDPPNSLPIVPYDLPYDALIRGLDENVIKGRNIDPGLLNHRQRTRWPLSFFNHMLLEEHSANALHVSLTPIINYNTTESVSRYKKLFEETIGEWKKGEDICIKFRPRVQIFTRYDYNKFFLIFALAEETDKVLQPLADKLSGLRSQIGVDMGRVIGEREEDPVMSQEDLHMTLGVCAFPAGEDYFSSNTSFGMYELQYMNQVLLLPKDELLAKYGNEIATLDYVSDVKLELTPEEQELLTFSSRELVLAITGGQLKYRI